MSMPASANSIKCRQQVASALSRASRLPPCRLRGMFDHNGIGPALIAIALVASTADVAPLCRRHRARQSLHPHFAFESAVECIDEQHDGRFARSVGVQQRPSVDQDQARGLAAECRHTVSARHSGRLRFAEIPNSHSPSLAKPGMRFRALNHGACLDANGTVMGSRAIRLSRTEKPVFAFVVMKVLYLHLCHVDAGRAVALAALAADAEVKRLVYFVAGDAVLPIWPEIASRSVLARPRVTCCSSRVTR